MWAGTDKGQARKGDTTMGNAEKTVVNDLGTCKAEAKLVSEEQGQPCYVYKTRAGSETYYGLIVESIVAKYAKELPKGSSLLKRIAAFHNHLDSSGLRVFVGEVTAVLDTFSPKAAKAAKAAKAPKTQPVLIAAKAAKAAKAPKK